jgi:hypothetical protein
MGTLNKMVSKLIQIILITSQAMLILIILIQIILSTRMGNIIIIINDPIMFK